MSTVPERLPTPRYCQLCGRNLIERHIAAERRMRLQCESCEFIHYINPRVVAAIIVSHGANVLLQRRALNPRAGFWTVPGGFLEIGETAAEGARRETLEETALAIDQVQLVGVYSSPHSGIVLIAYAAESATRDAIVGDAESLEVRWFQASDIPWQELAFDTTEQALRDWLRRGERT
jgi:ADP-ribose pyrophosphatase YjhB (NUDIX family)